MRWTGHVHEADFKALDAFRFNEGEVIADVGSNRGEALQSLLIAAPESMKLVGFEPNPWVFQKLNRRFGRHPRVELHHVGVADIESSIALHIPFYRKWMFDGLASFDFASARDWLKTRMWRYRDELLEIRTLECPVIPLDRYGLNPGLIKIDVQGFELAVLRGAEETLKRSKPVVLIEALDAGQEAFLTPLGYRFYRYEQGGWTEGRGALNTFCVPEERWKRVAKPA